MEDFLKTYVSLIALLISVGTTLYAWFTAGGKKALDELTTHKKSANERMNDVERRVQKLEDLMPHLPDKDDFHKIELAMERLSGMVGVLTEKVTKNEAVVTRVDDYLRESGKMKSYDEKLTEDARLVMLRDLAKMPDGRLNETMLQSSLDTYGYLRSREWVKTQIRKLGELGAVHVDDRDGFLVASISRAGLDHAERRSVIEGVARPSPGA